MNLPERLDCLARSVEKSSENLAGKPIRNERDVLKADNPTVVGGDDQVLLVPWWAPEWRHVRINEPSEQFASCALRAPLLSVNAVNRIRADGPQSSEEPADNYRLGKTARNKEQQRSNVSCGRD